MTGVRRGEKVRSGGKDDGLAALTSGENGRLERVGVKVVPGGDMGEVIAGFGGRGGGTDFLGSAGAAAPNPNEGTR